MACCSGSVVLEQLWLSACPVPPRLMLATETSLVGSESVRVLVAQSIPQITCDDVPLPCAFRTLAAKSLVPGATPTTPDPLFRAPIVPATWLPWPLSSFGAALDETQFLPAAAFRSG